MTDPPHPPISVIAPVAPAFGRLKTILFAPFDLEKWITIGFCAWLAYLGEGMGGGSGTGNINLGQRARQWQGELMHAKDWVLNNLHWIIPVAVVLLLLGLALWLGLSWVSSRGHFMFLHCVATDRAEVREPWNTYAAQANSLFFFRIILGPLAFLFMAPALAACAWLISSSLAVRETELVAIATVVVLVILSIIIGLSFFVVRKLTFDFVVPLMFLERSSCWTAWRDLLALMSGRAAQILLYLLFQFALHLAIGILILAVVLVTCCIAGCILALPYIGTVLLLPILVFERSYSLYYLAQFDPQYDVFRVSP